MEGNFTWSVYGLCYGGHTQEKKMGRDCWKANLINLSIFLVPNFHYKNGLMIERSALILEQTARHNPSFFLQQCTMGQLVKNCSKTIMLIHDESNSYASSNNIHVWTIFAKYKHTFLISFGWFGMEKPSLNVFKLKSVNQAGPKNVCP